MKKIIALTFFTVHIFFGQDKSKILNKNETITITNKDNNIQILTNVFERRLILKAKNVSDFQFSLTFDSFSEINNIEGNVIYYKKGKKKESNTINVFTRDLVQDDIFHSDLQAKEVRFPYIEDSTTVELSYEKKYKNPKLVPFFVFQDELLIEDSELTIVCDPTIEIGYKLFGQNQDKINFIETNENGKKIYKWKAKNIEPFEEEDNMPSPAYYLPHIIYYIKSYQKDEKKTNLLNTVNDLYQWYSELTLNSNTKDQNQLKLVVNELIKSCKTEEEKAKIIFNWVQKNLNYVAFEYGMGGFIPRDAVDVFEKKYGDCKDMANLINQMLLHAGLQSSLTWIGTRIKPYTYNDLPSPLVDNHMIASVLINNTRYYLDATDKFCPFTYPSSMIQSKQVLIDLKNKYELAHVPIVPAQKNQKTYTINYAIENTSIKGNATVEIKGLSKSYFNNILANNSQKEDEIVKGTLTNTNNQLNAKVISKNLEKYEDKPSTIELQIELENNVKNLSGKTIFKPFILFPYKESSINLENRKYGLEFDYLTQHNINYSITIPENKKVEFLPQNYTFSNETGLCTVKYTIKNNKIEINNSIEIKKINIEKDKLDQWNEFIKNCNKIYNQSIILTNE